MNSVNPSQSRCDAYTHTHTFTPSTHVFTHSLPLHSLSHGHTTHTFADVTRFSESVHSLGGDVNKSLLLSNPGSPAKTLSICSVEPDSQLPDLSPSQAQLKKNTHYSSTSTIRYESHVLSYLQ